MDWYHEEAGSPCGACGCLGLNFLGSSPCGYFTLSSPGSGFVFCWAVGWAHAWLLLHAGCSPTELRQQLMRDLWEAVH